MDGLEYMHIGTIIMAYTLSFTSFSNSNLSIIVNFYFLGLISEAEEAV